MKKHSIGSKLLSTLLVLAMMLPSMPLGVLAALGDLVNVSTGLTGNIDTSSTISLPIKVYDYLNDGMLFEFAESPASTNGTGTNVWLRKENVSKPGFGIGTDFTLGNTNYSAVQYSEMSYTSGTATTGNTASLKYLNWSKGTSDPGCISVFDLTAEGYSNTAYKVSNIRYMTLVYRSNNGSNNQTVQFDMWNRTKNVRSSKASTTIDNRGTTWRYVVVDLNNTNAALTDEVTAVYGYMPSGIGVAFAAYFNSEAAANDFGKAALEYTGETYSNTGDNRAYGLLRYSRNTVYGNNNTTSNISEQYNSSGIHMADCYSDGEISLSSMDFGYSYLLQGTVTEGIATLGLLEEELSSKGYPVYKEATVKYLAEVLKGSLGIPEYDSTYGYKNYAFVKGATSSMYGGVDLAQWLRTRCSSMGDYNSTKSKNLVGTWNEVNENITTYMDAAYFLLNSIYVGGSYNTVMHDYDYLVLNKGTDTDGNEVYIFDGGFSTNAIPDSGTSSTVYDEDTNIITNSSAAGKTHYVYEVRSNGVESKTTYYPLLPIVDKNGNNTNGVTKSPYFLDPGVASTNSTGNTYKNRNFNYVITSAGEFVYHADDELYFEFEGDDDVYLFVDGRLVLDIGSAHSITKTKIKLNDYATILGLMEGETYDFNFYYMERHGVGANMRICTNIRVTDPSMITAKTAWQDGVQLDFGSIVDKDRVVEYGFSITNNGEENLHNITFTDNEIGVKLDYTNGLTVTGDRVYDINGGDLDESDLIAIIGDQEYTFETEDSLKNFLANLVRGSVDENKGNGLAAPTDDSPGETLIIRGIGYKLSDAQIKAGVFDNTVLTTATNKTLSKTLQGQASMRVFVPADPMYYEWAGHDLKIIKSKLIEDILAAANQDDNILNGKVSNLKTSNVNKIELVTKAGTVITSSYVSIDKDYNLTVNYPTPGSKVFYVKVTYNSSKNTVIVPVLMNVTDVEDSYFVLDYGLPVDLTDKELTKNDALTVPGRSTSSRIVAIGSKGGYADNNITFTTGADGLVAADFGEFKWDGKSDFIAYTPKKFLENIDTVQMVYHVYEDGLETSAGVKAMVNINKEVQMYKSVNVLPANVVYYEDNFGYTQTSRMPDSNYGKAYDYTPYISYFENAEISGPADADSVEIDSVESIKPVDDIVFKQSDNQDDLYGYDPLYAQSEGSDDICNLDVSADQMTAVKLEAVKGESQPKPLITFDFTGTGFELIARTDESLSGTVIVATVDIAELPDPQMSEDTSMTGEANFAGWETSGTIKKTIPVIMEFDNYDTEDEVIHQVPVVRVKDLDTDPGAYRVTVRGVQAYEYGEDNNKKAIDTYIFFDGLRIFQPMGAANEHYNAKENNAAFYEVRDLIIGEAGQQPKAAVVVANTNVSDTPVEIVVSGEDGLGTLYIENLKDDDDIADDNEEDDIINKSTVEMADYLRAGPNNEAYMYVGDNCSALMFRVKPVGDVQSFQIAARSIDPAHFFGSSPGSYEPAGVYYAVRDDEGNPMWTELATLTTSTETYYEVDLNLCPYIKNDNGEYYEVILQVYTGMVSYSSIKLTGLELVEFNKDEKSSLESNLYFNNGTYYVADSGTETDNAKNHMSIIAKQMRATEVYTAPESDVIVISDNVYPYPPIIERVPDNSDTEEKPDIDDTEEDDDTENDTEEELEEDLNNFDLLKLYTLTAVAGEGGKITPEGDLLIAFGASRTFRFIPDEGYEVADVLVNGKSVGAVSKYVLKTASRDTTVEVIFREIPVETESAETVAE